MQLDPVMTQMDLIAHLLEGMGYGVEVLYAESKIIVWLAEWPVVLELKRPRRTDGCEEEPCGSLDDDLK